MDSLADDVPDIESKLLSTGLFDALYWTSDAKGYIRDYVEMLAIKSKRIEYSFLRDYDDIYLFNDLNSVSSYLQIEGIGYHLLEDGLDCYRVFDQRKLYDVIYKGRPFKKYTRLLLAKTLGIPTYFSQSDKCIDVEVNSSVGMATPIDKPIIVMSKNDFETSVNEAGISALKSVFPLPQRSVLQGGVLILTTPNLGQLDGFPANVQPIDFYKGLLEYFADYSCFIKPHPHDYFDYTQIIEQSRIINRTTPIEMFRYYDGLKMNAAVTFSSTSIGSIEFCEKKYICRSDFQYPGVINLQVERLIRLAGGIAR